MQEYPVPSDGATGVVTPVTKKYLQSPLWWAKGHSTYNHPGPKCDMCRELEVIYGPMPSVEEMERAVAADRAANPPARRKKRIPAALRRRVFERDLYRCKHCDTHLDLTVDHIWPEKLGGETVFENLQTLCGSCNSRKGHRP